MPSVSEYFSILGLRPDAADFAHGNKLLDGVISKAGQVASAIGAAFAVDAIADFAIATIDAIPAIGDLADQTGFASEEIQRLGFAAVQSGSDAETLNASLLKFTKNVGEAAGGSKGLIETFAKLGISTAGIEKRNPAELFGEVADGLSKIESVAKRAEIAQTLFGLSGTKLVPFLAQGQGAISALGDEADRLGIVLSDLTIREVGAVDDRVKALDATFAGLRRGLVVSALPAIEAIVKALGKLASFTSRALDTIKKFEKPIKVVAATLTALAIGAAAKWLLTLGFFVVGNIAAIASNSTLTASYGILAGAIDIAALSAGRFLLRLAAVAIPALAVAGLVAVVVLAIDDLITTIQGGDSFFGSFSGKFDDLTIALAKAAGDDGLGFFQRVFAGLGAVVTGTLFVIDEGFNQFFVLVQKVIDLGSFVADIFTSPAETLRGFLRGVISDFSAFVGEAAKLAQLVAGAVGSVAPDFIAKPLASFAAAAGQVQGSDVSSAILSSPTIRAAVDGRSSSNNVTVGAPAVNVTITGVSDPAAAAAAVNNSAGSALDQSLRAAAVDLLPGAG